MRFLFGSIVLTACATVTPAPSSQPGEHAGYSVSSIALPGSGADGVFMDYLLHDPRTGTIWVPAGNTGNVDVVEVATGKVTPIAGFPTQEVERRGKKRVVGPSAAALGEGVVYIGNRGDSSICAVDEKTLQKGACVKLDSSPDGVLYIAPTKEVWVTTPRDKSIRILDGSSLEQKARLEFDGQPEGFAADGTRGRFYTNLEDKDRTLAIDVATRKVVATWNPACGEDGPHGLRIAEQQGFLFVACSERTKTLDAGHDGAVLGSIETGDGVDDLDYVSTTQTLYIGAAKAARLTIASVGERGNLSLVAAVPTQEGVRNGVVGAGGKVFLSHAKGGELLVVGPAAGGH